ncbi:MAG: AI-2E family transporter, partial [Rubrivivax sp.]|nr:AI-2E family transporter [Rubrivivax sp.]
MTPPAAPAGEQAAPASPPVQDPPETTVPMAVNVRSLSLAVLAVLAIVFMLRWASAVLIPLMLGRVRSYALTPLVDVMARRRLPRLLAAGLVMFGIVGGMAASAYYLADDAVELVEALPAAAKKLRDAVQRSGKTSTPISQVQEAAAHLEAASKEANKTPRIRDGVQVVRVERPGLDLKEYLWSGTMGLVTLTGQFTIVLFITVFLLASGDTFRRKIVRIAGGRLSKRKLTVQAMDEISDQIQGYLLVQLGISVLVGIATWLAFLWIGLDNAAVWGIGAGVLNLVPYIGPIAVTAASVLVAFLQFGTVQGMLLVAAAGLVIHIIAGYVLAPWLTSRAAKMSPVVVFVGVMAWGWLWGVWGLLLGIPIMMMVKSICDRVEELKPIGELLGD